MWVRLPPTSPNLVNTGMMDTVYKKHFKFDGLNHAKQLEADRIRDTEAEMKRKLELLKKEEELKRTHYGRLDPTHMEFNLPVEPVAADGDISLDPNDMIFDFE